MTRRCALIGDIIGSCPMDMTDRHYRGMEAGDNG
jgi:hypothetical protein